MPRLLPAGLLTVLSLLPLLSLALLLLLFLLVVLARLAGVLRRVLAEQLVVVLGLVLLVDLEVRISPLLEDLVVSLEGDPVSLFDRDELVDRAVGRYVEVVVLLGVALAVCFLEDRAEPREVVEPLVQDLVL